MLWLRSFRLNRWRCCWIHSDLYRSLFYAADMTCVEFFIVELEILIRLAMIDVTMQLLWLKIDKNKVDFGSKKYFVVNCRNWKFNRKTFKSSKRSKQSGSEEKSCNLMMNVSVEHFTWFYLISTRVEGNKLNYNFSEKFIYLYWKRLSLTLYTITLNLMIWGLFHFNSLHDPKIKKICFHI